MSKTTSPTKPETKQAEPLPANLHPDDIRDPLRIARDRVGRALALLIHVERLRHEKNDAKNASMIGMLTEDAHAALAEAFHEIDCGLSTVGGE